MAPERSPISRGPVITTIVLIKAEPKQVPQCAMKLAGIDGVTEVYSVSGEWDLVAIVRVAEYALGRRLNASVDACVIRAASDSQANPPVQKLALVLSDLQARTHRVHN